MGSQLNTKDPQDLLFGSSESLAGYLGIDVRTARRYKAGFALPAPCFKLLQIRYGDLSGVFGPEWDGFTIGRDGRLYVPMFSRGLTADHIKGLFFEHQEVVWLRREVKRIAALLQRATADRWAAEKIRLLYSPAAASRAASSNPAPQRLAGLGGKR